MAVYVELGALLIAVAILYLLFGTLKNATYLVANSVMGIIIFLILNSILGIGIPLNIFSIGIVAIGGIAGVLLVLLIHFLGLGF